MFTPAGVLGTWLRGLFAIAMTAGGIWLVSLWYDQLPKAAVQHRTTSAAVSERSNHDPTPEQHQRRLTPRERISIWRPGFDRATLYLLGGLGLMAWSFGGRVLNPLFWRKAASTAAPTMPQGKVHHILRPDGTRLHVEIYGPQGAPTVVLTHGWSLNSNAWAYLLREWGNRFRLVVWDLPGLGQSTRPVNRDFSLEKMAHDLRAVLDLGGPQPTVLVGHSIGGMITLTLCRLFPELLGNRVSRLVLVHTTYQNPLRTMFASGLMTALQKPLIEPLLYLQIALSPLVWIMNWFSYWNGSIHSSTARNGFSGTETRDKLNFVAAFYPQASPAVLARGSFGMLNYDARATLPTIKIPVLVVGGDRDPITRPEASETISSETAAGRLQMLQPAKHFGHIEYDSQFAENLAHWIEQVETPRIKAAV